MNRISDPKSPPTAMREWWVFEYVRDGFQPGELRLKCRVTRALGRVHETNLTDSDIETFWRHYPNHYRWPEPERVELIREDYDPICWWEHLGVHPTAQSAEILAAFERLKARHKDATTPEEYAPWSLVFSAFEEWRAIRRLRREIRRYDPAMYARACLAEHERLYCLHEGIDPRDFLKRKRGVSDNGKST